MLKINVVGNIASDFQMRTRGEQKYAIIRIASDRRYTDKNGNALVDYVSVKVRGPLAESCVKHLGKGSKIAVTGNFETIMMPDDEGKMRQTGFLIKAYEVEFLVVKPRNDAEVENEQFIENTKGDVA